MDKKMECLNIYYLNFSKVYEIFTMINNAILSTIQRESANGFMDRLTI